MSHSSHKIIVVGLGGQARVVASVARACGYEVAGFLDAFGKPLVGMQINGTPVLGELSFLSSLESPVVGLAVGDNHRREQIARLIGQTNASAQIISLVHPRTFIESGVFLGSHVTICVGAIICTGASIGKGAIINSGAIVEHECSVGHYCHISSGVQLGGRVAVGSFSHVGIGATVIDKIRVGNDCIIGGGAVVVRDVTAFTTSVGVPARVIKCHGIRKGDLSEETLANDMP